MKQLILLVFGFVLMANTSFATEVPDVVEKAFAQKFPTAKKVKWEKEKDGNYEAEFTLDGKETSATYSADGSWKETETEIEVSELPAPVSASVEKMYPGTKIKEASRILRSDNSVVYETEIKVKMKEMDLLFNADGAEIK